MVPLMIENRHCTVGVEAAFLLQDDEELREFRVDRILADLVAPAGAEARLWRGYDEERRRNETKKMYAEPKPKSQPNEKDTPKTSDPREGTSTFLPARETGSAASKGLP